MAGTRTCFKVCGYQRLWLKADYEVRVDLRDPSTTPLNFTKSINLALSERGINSMRLTHCEGLLDAMLAETIPMHGRMIHGRGKHGDLYEEPQSYDAQGRVCRFPSCLLIELD